LSSTLTWNRALIGAGLLFLVGFGIGLSQSETIREVETVTETETRTPVACTDALDYAIEGLQQTSDLFRLAAIGNVTDLENAAADFAEWTQVNQPRIERASGECRAG
jgi:hypothetical protein